MSLPIKEIIKIGITQLENAGVLDAEMDAKELYCYMMGINRTKLMLNWQETLQDIQCERYFDLIAQRADGIPLQYITGSQEFMGLKFKVNETVLIPRQDTETMVEDALDIIRDNTLRNNPLDIKEKKGWTVLDLCCGSGAIGVSLAKCAPITKVTCSDVSDKAVSTARANAAANQVGAVTFVQSDMFAEFNGKLGKKKFDMIISNPPYIKRTVIPTLQREVRDHEPMLALDGGQDGLDYYRIIAAEAGEHLKKEGVLILEIGFDQRDEVTALLEEAGKYENIICLKDLRGLDRIIVAFLQNTKKNNKKILEKTEK